MIQLNTTPQRPATQRLARAAVGLLLAGAAALASGCRKEDMAQQPRYNAMVPSGFFGDGLSARPLVEGTVARNGQVVKGYDYDPTAGYEYGGNFPPDFPKSGDELKLKLERGRERFTIYCAMCHGDLGNGQGVIVKRGFTAPPSLYPLAADAGNDVLKKREERLMKEQPGYFYNVISNGYGAMYSYAARVKPEDRWAIAAYISALQLSQRVDLAQLSPEDQVKVKEGRKADKDAQEEAAKNPAGPKRNEP